MLIATAATSTILTHKSILRILTTARFHCLTTTTANGNLANQTAKHLLQLQNNRNLYLIQACRKMSDEEKKKGEKPPSKFKMFYRQYGPAFLVIHLATVVAWIYFFFLISKQGYDITQLLVLFEKINLMSSETVQSIHTKIENYKPEKLKGYITGNDIKHFVTAYMIYKVIAPFRYMVSIALTRSIVKKLRAIGIFKA